jgi:hypothetical protein
MEGRVTRGDKKERSNMKRVKEKRTVKDREK